MSTGSRLRTQLARTLAKFTASNEIYTITDEGIYIAECHIPRCLNYCEAFGYLNDHERKMMSDLASYLATQDGRGM